MINIMLRKKNHVKKLNFHKMKKYKMNIPISLKIIMKINKMKLKKTRKKKLKKVKKLMRKNYNYNKKWQNMDYQQILAQKKDEKLLYT